MELQLRLLAQRLMKYKADVDYNAGAMERSAEYTKAETMNKIGDMLMECLDAQAKDCIVELEENN